MTGEQEFYFLEAGGFAPSGLPATLAAAVVARLAGLAEFADVPVSSGLARDDVSVPYGTMFAVGGKDQRTTCPDFWVEGTVLQFNLWATTVDASARLVAALKSVFNPVADPLLFEGGDTATMLPRSTRLDPAEHLSSDAQALRRHMIDVEFLVNRHAP